MAMLLIARAMALAALATAVGCGSDDESCDGRCGSKGCGDCPDEPMVAAGDLFRIDACEVTGEQYAKFLAVHPGDPRAECSTEPLNGWPPADPALPVTYIQLCQADKYCRWAGKRLCGRIGDGETITEAEATDPTKSEWHHACTGGGTTRYPYGNTYDRDACNTEGPALVPPGSLPGCEGGLPGLFDMTGNVLEWENGEGFGGNIMRAGFGATMPELGCANIGIMGGQGTSDRSGFRCCADPI